MIALTGVNVYTYIYIYVCVLVKASVRVCMGNIAQGMGLRLEKFIQHKA